jgi:hypothetical protein
MKPIVVVVHVHDIFMGFKVVVPRMSSGSHRPRTSCKHPRLEVLWSLVMGSFLDLLDEEVELGGEHFHLLDGVHALV